MNPFDERLDELEAKLANLGIADLPLAALQRKLEQDWQPSASTLLGPRSVTAAMLTTREVAGYVSAAGAVIAGSGFTVIKNVPPGDYTVLFSTPFTTLPVVVVGSGAQAAAFFAQIKGGADPTVSSFGVLTFTAAGAAADRPFTFRATGGS